RAERHRTRCRRAGLPWAGERPDPCPARRLAGVALPNCRRRERLSGGAALPAPGAKRPPTGPDRPLLPLLVQLRRLLRRGRRATQVRGQPPRVLTGRGLVDRKSTRLNSSHVKTSYAV